ncbi:hypothetical protein Tco_0664283 [Tanacetum coccineum]
MQTSQLKETRSEANRTLDFRALDFQIIQLTEKVTTLQEQNELFKAENAKVKQHYKELYDSIKITRAKHIEQTTALTTENENLKAQIHENLKCNTLDSIKPRVLAPGRYAIYVEPIPPNIRNNREVHLDYLKHLKESVETLLEIVEEAKVRIYQKSQENRQKGQTRTQERKSEQEPGIQSQNQKKSSLQRTIDQAAGGKLRDKNAEESWALLKDLALYDNESWNDPRDFAKPIKAISLPQDVPNTSDLRLIELENQVQRLMEAHLAPKSPVQNKIGTHPPLKHVHFINSIILLRKEDELEEEGIMEPNAAKGDDHSITIKIEEEVKEERLKSKRKPSNPEKISNFVGKVKGLKVFVGNFTYEFGTFVVHEGSPSVIDHYLGGMILGKTFVKEIGLVYDKDEETITFERDKEKITFKMPHKMGRFKHIDKDILKTDNIPPFIITGDDGDQEKTHYSNSLNLGPAYRRDESVTKAIQCIIKMKSREDEGGVT